MLPRANLRTLNKILKYRCKTRSSQLLFCHEKKHIQETIVSDTNEVSANEFLDRADVGPRKLGEDYAEIKAGILRQAEAEKEREACFRSRLAKECHPLFLKQLSKIEMPTYASTLRVHEEPITNWEEVKFEGFTGKLDATELVHRRISTSSSSSSTPSSSSSSSDKYRCGKGGKSDDKKPKPTRPVRGEPGKVLFCVIPIEWVETFYPITGISGFWTFLVTVGTFLISKEFYVLEHNYYGGLSTAVLWWAAIKYVGPTLTPMLDKMVDDYEAEWQKGRDAAKGVIDEAIANEKHMQFQSEGRTLLIAAKRENVLLQLEEEMRKREMHVYEEVKKRLDYHLKVETVRQKIQQKNLVQYVQAEVNKAITPEMRDKMIYYSIDAILKQVDGEKK